VAAAPALTVPGTPVAQAPVRTEAPAPEKAVAKAGPEAPALEASVLAKAKPQDPAETFSGLTQQAPDPFKALAQQVAKDVAVQQNAFSQVTQALKDAPGVESGRLVIRLKPASLGDVTVDLVMAGGKLSARLVASSADVRDAFVRDLAGFKAGLESHGVAVSEVSVALKAGLQDQPQGGGQGQPDQSWWRGLASEKASDIVPTPAPAVYGGLDLGGDQRFSALA
jgi:flagellar hook-length control protein FliK